MTTVGPYPPSATDEISGGAGTGWNDPSGWDDSGNPPAQVDGYGEDPGTKTLYAQFNSLDLPADAVVSQLKFKAGYAAATPIVTSYLHVLLGSISGSVITGLPCSIGWEFVPSDDDVLVTINVSVAQSAAIKAAWNAGTLVVYLFLMDTENTVSPDDGFSIGGNLGSGEPEMSEITYTEPSGDNVVFYDRTKIAISNPTGIALTTKACEMPNALAAMPTAGGESGIVRVLYTADADESGGADVQNHARFKFTPGLTTGGQFSVGIEFVPIGGAGGDGTTQSATLVHPQSMDDFQADGGRPRQP